ncbi:CysZ-like protein [Aureimonas altamirensis]|uniref:CysZ-like protein n=1 Tax=Aureimonas altamirensis TaxID=370622 RepID=A0A0B1Q3C3_9HYPH|nr:sulfate transporter family protein [Aureimonas altamirensis]KHJ53402.1 CysZ-like protein [Aureimonas altamirensis]
MILSSARLALRDIVSPPFRSTLWKVLGLTAVVLVALWFGVRWLFAAVAIPFFADFAPDMPAWIDNAGAFAGIAAGIVLAVLMAFLIAPVSAIIAGLFLDDVAEAVERKDYADQPEGRALPLVRGMVLSVKFFGIVILGNLIAFALLWVPLVNVGAFFVVNGYLLGHEYFQFASLRYRSEDQAAAMRNRNGGRIFIAGLVIAACLAIPIVNLLTPLFAAAMMVHLHQKLSRREGGVPQPGPVI